MTDNEIFADAISVIAATPTGQGNIHLRGIPEYDTRFSEYAKQTLKLLRDYLKDDEIAFHPLSPKKYADSARWFGANIRINQRFRKSIPVVATR